MSRSSYKDWGPNPIQWPIVGDAFEYTKPERMAEQDAYLPPHAEIPPIVQNAADEFVGITVDGTPHPELFERQDEGFDNSAAVAAAARFLEALGDQARLGTLPLDAPEWRLWTNAFRAYPAHGVLLQNLETSQIERALAVVEASVSPSGYHTIRDAMRLNDLLGEVVGRDRYPTTLTEYCYRMTIFGRPSHDEPWGWQLSGHHVDVHGFIWGGQISLTPIFLGAEIEGTRLFEEQRTRARALMHSLDPDQRSKAVLYDSMLTRDLPPELNVNLLDGRVRAGAGRDNRVLPFEGIAGSELSPHQRELLLAMIEPYVANLPDGPRDHRVAQIAEHLADTWVCWIGDTGEDSPFYYKVHGPTVLIEYDNHAGVFWANPEPEPFHVHIVVRTPNGGDYGKALLRQR